MAKVATNKDCENDMFFKRIRETQKVPSVYAKDIQRKLTVNLHNDISPRRTPGRPYQGRPMTKISISPKRINNLEYFRSQLQNGTNPGYPQPNE